MSTPPALDSYRPYWAKRFGIAPFLPMSRAEMDELGWDSCDIILVTGDAYIDHPSFGMALVGRLLEAQGFRVGIIAQPDWQTAEPFKALGRPNLYFGVTAGNMDSMVNRYTAERKIRSDDAYTPGGEGGKRPDRAVLVYSSRCREAYPDATLVIGSIEASLRRIAHYDYWSDKVRRSMLVDSKADILLYGNAERALLALTHRLAKGEKIGDITDLRGTAFMRKNLPEGWLEVDSVEMDHPGHVHPHPDPYAMEPAAQSCAATNQPASIVTIHPSPLAGEGQERGGNHLSARDFARRLRKDATNVEHLLWQELRAHRFFDLKFKRQQPLGDYIVDFVCLDKRVVVELDGGQHADRATYDKKRDHWLNQQGFKVLRFWNNEVLENKGGVLETIARTCGIPFPDRNPLSPTLSHEGGGSNELPSPLMEERNYPSPSMGEGQGERVKLVGTVRHRPDRVHTVVRLPSYEQVSTDPVMYAHASRVLHLESNPGNARSLVQRHGDRDVWLNPPPIPLTTREMDYVYGLPYARAPHPAYRDAKIPAWEMIHFSVNIMRGCFGGCTFCSITEHEGRIIQNRSEQSILHEIEEIRDKVEGFTGIISDLGGPTANMYRLACKDRRIEAACRKLSCVYPDICDNLNTDHSALVQLYRKARQIKGVKKILIGSGLRYDLAVRSPEYVRELVQHHVGGYLKIAPEHSEEGPLSKMMKPGMAAYERFKLMFDKFSREAGKEQYLIPYFIAAHPGTTDEDMLNLALWLKRNNFRLDQVQTFTPTPMAMATAMYHSGKNPLHKVTPTSEDVPIPKAAGQRKLHKAFLRYHDPANWPLLREALRKMGRADLIGNGKKHLVPSFQPVGTAMPSNRRRLGEVKARVGGVKKPAPRQF